MNCKPEMKRFIHILTILSLLASLPDCQRRTGTKPFRSYWEQLPDRYWIGPEFWANRLQDWRLHNGRVECLNPELPKRTLHFLECYLSGRPGSLDMQVATGSIRRGGGPGAGDYSGFLIAAGNESMDYRRRALIHGACGRGGGMIAAVSSRGKIFLLDNETGQTLCSAEMQAKPGVPVPESFLLSLVMTPRGELYQVRLCASDPETREELAGLDTLISRTGNFSGSLALVCNGGPFWFSGWEISGSKVRMAREHELGPVIGTLYTLSDRTLKLTAQLPPLSESDEQVVEFQVRDARAREWKTLATSQIMIPQYTANFRVNNWMEEVRSDYRIVYKLPNRNGSLTPFYYYGVIVQDPGNRDELVVAAFTGNSNSHGGITGKSYDFSERIWFPHEDLISSVAKHQPDLLIYTGDNVYEGRPTPADLSSVQNTALDYLYKWYMFLWAHGDLTRNIPSITIPDDHDVYQGNLWGASGVKAPARPPSGTYPDYYRGMEGYWQQDQGGYKLPPELVNMIQQTQTSHLPDPYDPSPVRQGIGVYYCNMNYGRVSWAILEDRKFKSAPARIHPEYHIVNGFAQARRVDGRQLDSPDATLLGERQLSFLRDWAGDWQGVDMKVAISQTLLANLTTYPDTFLTDAHTPRLPALPPGVIPKDYRKARDMDSNGWPQTGRNKALNELRKGFALMICGDQHLGSVLHHGIDDWEDAGYSFCVPSIANLWPRRWFPSSPGDDHQPGMPPYTGRYLDGFGNRITVHSVSNPQQSGKEPALLHDAAPGYGIIRLNKRSQFITLECWPRHCDPEAYNASQYPGWPVTLRMEDNYGRKKDFWLPPMSIEGLERPPVLQIVDEITGEIIYTLRIPSSKYQPGVFEEGTYTIRLSEPGTAHLKTIPGLVSINSKEQDTLLVVFQ